MKIAKPTHCPPEIVISKDMPSKLSPDARVALPAFLDMMRAASREETPVDELIHRVVALGAEHALGLESLGEVLVFSMLIHARELGGDPAAQRIRDEIATVFESIS